MNLKVNFKKFLFTLFTSIYFTCMIFFLWENKNWWESAFSKRKIVHF